MSQAKHNFLTGAVMGPLGVRRMPELTRTPLVRRPTEVHGKTPDKATQPAEPESVKRYMTPTYASALRSRTIPNEVIKALRAEDRRLHSPKADAERRPLNSTFDYDEYPVIWTSTVQQIPVRTTRAERFADLQEAVFNYNDFPHGWAPTATSEPVRQIGEHPGTIVKATPEGEQSGVESTVWIATSTDVARENSQEKIDLVTAKATKGAFF